MEVRCGSCNKLFRVSDDKITGIGIKFACTKCGDYVKVTTEDFERYEASNRGSEPASLESMLPSFGSDIVNAGVEPFTAEDREQDLDTSLPSILDDNEEQRAGLGQEDASSLSTPELDLSEALPSILGSQPEELQPEHTSALKSVPVETHAVDKLSKDIGKTESPFPAQEPEVLKVPETGKPEQVAPRVATIVKPVEPAPSKVKSFEATRPSPKVISNVEKSVPAGRGKKSLALVAALLFFIAGGAFAAKWYLEKTAPGVPPSPASVKQIVAPDGLAIVDPSGQMDSATGDLVITGKVENVTDKPKSDWYIMSDVYDAQNSILMRARLLNGKQVYTKRDYEILARRGANVEELKQKSLQEQGKVIPAKGSVNFELHVMEPPARTASFNATLQPFDPVQLLKEIADEQK